MQKRIILLSGPTASGKSKLAISLAKKINGQIINADSMQIYQELSVLTSRPEIDDLKEIKHHLYGFQSVKKDFSVGAWLKILKKKIKLLEKSKITPIIVGGTGLYFNAITKGISQIPEINTKFRNEIRNLYVKIGAKKFFEKLIEIDPISQKKILPSDKQRVLRAYEVKKFTKKSMFEWAKKTKSDFIGYDLKKIYLQIPKEELLKKIQIRTQNIIQNGAILEVENFLKLNIKNSLSANKIIGIREIKSFLDGSISLKEAEQAIIIKTRQYAKRQNTWCRGYMANWHKIYSKDPAKLLKKVLKVVS